MTRQRGGYAGARSCTGGPQPGSWGAMDWFLHNYQSKGGVNSGIYNCRSVRGGRTTSLHGEGRASDMGIRPYSAEYGTKLANAIVNQSKELGVQCVIWNERIWSSSYPDRWRYYSGVARHKDHLHVEFTWASAKRARDRQRNLWAKILGGGAGGSTSSTGGGSSTSWVKVNYGALLKRGVKGNPVKDVQTVLKAHGIDLGKGGVDGYFGDKVEAGVRKMQEAWGLSVDGIVGPKSWNKFKADKAFKSHKPAKKPKTKATVPGPGYAFPLGKGRYFGPKSGGNDSVSGYYGRSFKGVKDHDWLKRFATQLVRRGWSVGKGKTYLNKSGNDGKFGPEYAALIKAFQRDQGLKVDGLLGEDTWNAAFKNRIS